jgi:hypothetical protein
MHIGIHFCGGKIFITNCAIEPCSYLPKNYELISGVLILTSLLLDHSYETFRSWSGISDLLEMNNLI